MKRLAAAAVVLCLAAVTAACGGNADSSAGGVFTTIDALKPGIDANAPINPYNPKGNAFGDTTPSGSGGPRTI